MINKKDINKLKHKLCRAITKAGLSWATYSGLIVISDKLNGKPFPENFGAVWVYNNRSKREQVIIPPKTIESQTATELAITIKHEFLHKAMYRGIRNASNNILVNIALDAVINKILFLSHPKQMVQWCKKNYKPDTKTGPLCLVNSSISTRERELIPDSLRGIFDELYWCANAKKTLSDLSHKDANPKIPDPLTLYHHLANALSSEQKQKISDQYSFEDKPENNKPDDGENKNSEPENKAPEDTDKPENSKPENSPPKNDKGKDSDPKNSEPENDECESDLDDIDELENYDDLPELFDASGQELVEDVIVRGGDQSNRSYSKNDENVEKEIAQQVSTKARGWSSTKNIKDIFTKYITDPKSAGVDELKKFVDSWYTNRQVEGIELSIYSEIASSISFDPYPGDLTRTGIEMIALGVSGPDDVPLYLNRKADSCKKKICAYIDTSPSMHFAISYVMHILDFFDNLEECEYAGGEHNGRYVFSSSVKGCSEKDWESFKNGTFYGGYGTSFESVLQHVLTNINEFETDIVLILTDGESSISQETIEKFNQTTMKCYVIYFSTSRNSFGTKRRLSISNLDELHGGHFIIHPPKINSLPES